ncbi:helix-turn-helix domain-containing protein [Archangium lansingense]|uniref:helix-turn-helix domain-containing protein n=1 Tax=Archangium lansingense TaxID=2995310 RepID=UPI003B7A3AF7
MSKKKKKNAPNEYSFEERSTPLIAQRGFTPISSAFLSYYAQLNITVGEAMLLIHLMSFKWTRDAPFPAISRLAKLMGCSERNIRKLCASLESVGYLKRVGRSGTSNQFDLSGLYAKLEDMINVERASASAPTAVPVLQPQTVPQPLRRQPPQTVPQPLRRQPPQTVSVPMPQPVSVPMPAPDMEPRPGFPWDTPSEQQPATIQLVNNEGGQ